MYMCSHPAAAQRARGEVGDLEPRAAGEAESEAERAREERARLRCSRLPGRGERPAAGGVADENVERGRGGGAGGGERVGRAGERARLERGLLRQGPLGAEQGVVVLQLFEGALVEHGEHGVLRHAS